MQIATTPEANYRLSLLRMLGSSTEISSFVISANALPQVDEESPRPAGPVVYTGTAAQMRYGRVSENEFVLYLLLEPELGLFGVGNVVVYLEPVNLGEQPIPLLWANIDLGNVTTKWQTTGNRVGNRIVIQMAIHFPDLQNVLPMFNIAPMYAQLRYTQNEITIGPAELLPWNAMVMERHSLYNGTTLVVKDNKNDLLWGVAPSFYINDPFIGQIRGGHTGDEYGSPSDIDYIDGRYYLEDTSNAEVLDGGDSWESAPQSAEATGTDGKSYVVIGG